MRKIGLIGGMSFEATAIYYRKINEAVRNRLGGFHSADILLRSVDFQTIVDMQQSARWADAGAYLGAAGKALEEAGAECLLICAVTMHLTAPAVEAATSVPVIHVIDETAARLKAAGYRRPLLIATRYTMENGFYQARMETHGIEVVVPDQAGRDATHAIIFDELCAGIVKDSSRDVLLALVETAKAEGADSLIFGCTEICMILDVATSSLPAFDSTDIHAEAAVDFALAG
jgi:aspartate racemase